MKECGRSLDATHLTQTVSKLPLSRPTANKGHMLLTTTSSPQHALTSGEHRAAMNAALGADLRLLRDWPLPMISTTGSEQSVGETLTWRALSPTSTQTGECSAMEDRAQIAVAHQSPGTACLPSSHCLFGNVLRRRHGSTNAGGHKSLAPPIVLDQCVRVG